MSHHLLFVSVMGPNGNTRRIRIPRYTDKSFLTLCMVGYRRFAQSVDILNDKSLSYVDPSTSRRVRSVVTRGEMNDLWDAMLLEKWTETVVCGSAPSKKQLSILRKAKLQKIGGRGVDFYWTRKRAANPGIPDHHFHVQPFQEPEVRAILNKDATDISDDDLTHEQLMAAYTLTFPNGEKPSPSA